MSPADSGAGFSQSLERGLAVLSSFTPERPELGISELARMLALTRSTAHRYVATLATLGYLHQDEATRKYRLGPRVLDLGFAVLGSLELREIAAPHLRRLAETTGHTANLAVRDDTDAILIDRVAAGPAAITTSSSACTSARGCRCTAAPPARPCSPSCRARISTGCWTRSTSRSAVPAR